MSSNSVERSISYFCTAQVISERVKREAAIWTHLQVSVEVVGAENLGNLDELVVVVVSVEEGLLAEDLHIVVNLARR